MVCSLNMEKFGEGKSTSVRKLTGSRIERHNPVWVGNREWPPKDGVEQGKDRRVRSDSQSQRHDDDRRESRASGQRPTGEPEVPEDALQMEKQTSRRDLTLQEIICRRGWTHVSIRLVVG